MGKITISNGMLICSTSRGGGRPGHGRVQVAAARTGSNVAEGSLHRDEMHHAAAAAGTSTSQRPARGPRGAHHVTSMELTTALGVGWSSGARRMGEEVVVGGI
jgi:hypothetical protein